MASIILSESHRHKKFGIRQCDRLIIVGKIIILLVNQIKISTNLLYQFVLKMVQAFFFLVYAALLLP